MPRTYYKSNKANNGGLLSVSFDSKDEKFWFNVVKQNGWDEQKNHGIFSGGDKAAISFNLGEIGGVLKTIQEYRNKDNGAFSFFHKSAKGTTNGSFAYWAIEPVKEGDKFRDGFGFTMKQGEKSFKVGMSTDEAFEFKQWLEFGLNHCYSAIYSQDKEERKARFEEKNQTQQPKQTTQAPKANVKFTKQPVKAAPIQEVEQTNEENNENSGASGEEVVDF